MSVIDDLEAASFRGVPFLVPREREITGKKIVVHDYPGSNERFVEELGTLPPTFQLNIIVHGSDAINQRKRLITELHRPGLGTLVHPVYGSVQVQAGEVTVTSSDTAVGKFDFSITFYRSEASISLAPVENSTSAVAAQAEVTRETALDGVLEAYDPPTFTDNITDAAEKLQDIYETVSNGVDSIVQDIGDAQARAEEFVRSNSDRVFATVLEANGLVDNLRSFFGLELSAVNTPSDGYDTWNNLTVFGDGDEPISETTTHRATQSNNRDLLNNITQTTAFINLSEAAAFTVYQNEDDLLSAIDTLQAVYVKLTEQAPDDSLSMQSDVRANLSELRNRTREVLEAQLPNVWRVKEIPPLETSMALLTYRYYGSLDNLETIKDLNPGVDHSYSNEAVKVIER